jgi:RNA polymerase nonessential primary-like sigma factor
MAENLTFKNIERTENLNRYLDDIKDFNIMTPDEEVDYIIKAQNGDIKARHHLVESNLRYIFSFAKKFSGSNNVLDIVDVAYIGFNDAITKFDVTKGFRLCTYANQWMGQKIRLYLMNEHLPVRKSNISKTVNKVSTIKNKFFTKYGRMPQIEEIQEELFNTYGIKIKETCDLVDVMYSSINQTTEDGESCYEESAEFNGATSSINEYEVESENDYAKALVATMLKTLSEREQKIIKKLFGLGCEPQEMDSVAEEMGMSKERIRQIKISVCKKLKETFGGQNKLAI